MQQNKELSTLTWLETLLAAAVEVGELASTGEGAGGNCVGISWLVGGDGWRVRRLWFKGEMLIRKKRRRRDRISKYGEGELKFAMAAGCR